MPKKGDTVVLAGTRKGLFLFESRDRRRWRVQGPWFEGVQVNSAVLDPRDGKTVWAAVNSMHWGPTIARSTSWGARWARPKQGPSYPKGSGLSVSKVWSVQPGAGEEVWAGVEPAGLFRSDDAGQTWDSVEGLNARKDRGEWQPGGGGLCLHTILPNPRDERRMTVGISSAGILVTSDGGATWQLLNGGIRHDYLPSKRTEEDQLGTCPHKMVRDARDPAQLYMQNHFGLFKRHATDSAWQAMDKGLPTVFGFPMAAHPHDAGTLYTVPLEADANRVAPGGKFAVQRTRDGGQRWQRVTKGLPQKGAYYTVLREGLAVDTHDPAGVYVGTTTGQLYGSRDEGASWSLLADGLPQVVAVGAGVVG
jgi:hypothetical protein